MRRAAVITVSDSTHNGTREDRSGPLVAERLEQQGFVITDRSVVPDERHMIADRLRLLADRQMADLIVTTGGTGIAARDVTPEATRDVIEREIPGFGEQMRAKGREMTRFAALSRALAGTRGPVLIINLPGSPRGAVDSLNAILELVPHVLDLIGGRTEHDAPAVEA